MNEPVVIRSLRDLDALVAEKILGWQWYPWFGNSEQFIIAPSKDHANSKDSWGRDVRYLVPPYSIDLNTVWELAESLDAANYGLSLQRLNGRYLAQVGFEQRFGVTAPLAICLAALKTVGIEVQFQL